MSKDIFSEVITRIFEMVLEAAFVLWQELMIWTCSELLKWVKTDMIPLMEESIRLAFMATALIAASLIKTVELAWKEVRKFLLEAFVEFEKSTRTSDKWVRKITAVLIKSLDATRPVVVKKEVEEEINWDNLPSDVRAAWIKKNRSPTQKIDLIATREQELEALQITQ